MRHTSRHIHILCTPIPTYLYVHIPLYTYLCMHTSVHIHYLDQSDEEQVIHGVVELVLAHHLYTVNTHRGHMRSLNIGEAGELCMAWLILPVPHMLVKCVCMYVFPGI